MRGQPRFTALPDCRSAVGPKISVAYVNIAKQRVYIIIIEVALAVQFAAHPFALEVFAGPAAGVVSANV